jgi:pimeloyl-ACP methyl ester carboxylesterase
MAEVSALDAGVLPAGVRSRFVDGVNGLRMHVLEAGWEGRGRPGLLLLHGFPEIAYSWRKTMPALAEAGYHVIAPDQRGYGRTTGWDASYDGDLRPFRMVNLVRDNLALLDALGWRTVAGVIGHDFGAVVAPWCALIRPDVFRSVAIMSAPFSGPPPIAPKPAAEGPTIHQALAALKRPRKHYQWYYSTPPANADMWSCPQGVHAFLRAYFHHKSADWKQNKPFRLAGWTAEELAKMPTYYIMDWADDMAEGVAKEAPSAAEIAACKWLTEDELRVYSGEYERIGFQGGLQMYRCRTLPWPNAELNLFAGRTIDVPAMFIAGKSDWGIYQVPGAIEAMQERACADFRGCHLLEGAGHWVQQEQPEQVNALLLEFLRGAG